MISEEMKKEMPNFTRDIAEQLLNIFERQKFADWYNGKFDDYLTGERKISRDEIVNDIVGML